MKPQKKILFRSLSGILAVIVSLLSFSSCFDLGDYGEAEYGDYQGYYEALGEVSAYYENSKHTYSVEHSLFTVSTVNSLSWDTENGDEPVAEEAYYYIAVPFAEAASIDSVTLFFYSSSIDFPKEEDPDDPSDVKPKDPKKYEEEQEKTCFVTVTAFLLNDESEIPSHPRKKGDPEYKEVIDPEAPGGRRKVPIDYDDPAPETALTSSTLFLNLQEWGNTTLDAFRIAGGTAASVPVQTGNLLLLRIENNAGYSEDLYSLKFAFTNLLIHRAN